MTLTLCVTTSCSSLAMRERSTSTARRVAALCSASARRSRAAESLARLRHSRIPSPAATTGITTRSAVYRSETRGRVFGKVIVMMIAPVSTTPTASWRYLL